MIPKFRDIGLALAIVVIAACAQYNAVGKADTIQQKALAAYGSVAIVVEQIAALVKPGTLPRPVQATLIQAGETGGTVAKEGMKLYLQAESARTAFQADAAQEGRLVAALNSLDDWITRATKAKEELQVALRGAQ